MKGLLVFAIIVGLAFWAFGSFAQSVITNQTVVRNANDAKLSQCVSAGASTETECLLAQLGAK